MRIETTLVQVPREAGDAIVPSSPPIYQTATFLQPSIDERGPYDYTRSGNPTRHALEAQLCALEGGQVALAYASGMAAITAVCRLCAGRGAIVAGTDLYGGTYRLLARVLAPQGVEVRYVDASQVEAVRAALARPAGLLLVESPSNPRLDIADLRALSIAAHKAGALLAVDNSLMTPYLQRPLSCGADIVLHSATKGLCGHADVTAGAVVVRDPDLGRDLAFHQNAEGNALAPFEAWLLQRGMNTLAVRLARQQQNAADVAAFLSTHPDVRSVRYPGLGTHPGAAVHASQSAGGGCVVCLETGSLEASCRLVEALELFSIAVSFGSVHSTVSLPCRMSHASMPAHVRSERGLPEDLVRLSIGIEDPGDLVADLRRALATTFAAPEFWPAAI